MGSIRAELGLRLSTLPVRRGKRPLTDQISPCKVPFIIARGTDAAATTNAVSKPVKKGRAVSTNARPVQRVDKSKDPAPILTI
jgi:hypothetical protein